MTATTTMVCGCATGHAHTPTCELGRAETIACAAYDAAINDDADRQHGLLTALTALVNAGMLRDLPEQDPQDVLYEVLDDLWQAGLLGPVADEPRCEDCGEPERLLATGAVGHFGPTCGPEPVGAS